MIETTLSEISRYLTEEIIDKAFKLHTGSEDSIKSITLSRAAPAGEGLLSAVYRIHVTGYIHKARFIVKGLVKDPVLRRSLDCQRFFARESEFFVNILPILSEFQISTGAKERIRNHVPKCYGCHIDAENDYILIEDLAETNCKDISGYLSQENKSRVLDVLAHFHAVSMALRHKKPDFFDKIASKIPEIYFTPERRKWYAQYLQNAIDIDRNVLAEFFNSENFYIKKFDEIVKQDPFGELVTAAMNRGDNAVICHGDCWCPNFLLSKERSVAIDFQLVRCTSPATDIGFFILTNECKDKKDFNDAIEIYYKALDYYLKDMGISLKEVFSRDTLTQELKKYGKFIFFTAMTSIPLLASKRCDVLESTNDKFPGADTVPLEHLWNLIPIESMKHKLRLVNAVRVAVETGLI